MKLLSHLSVVAGLVLAPTSSVHAYRTLADDPELMSSEPITWADPIVVMELAPVGASAARLSLLADALEQASRALEQPACSAFRVTANRTGVGPAQPGDGRNTVEWVATGWTRRGFEPEVAGVTEITLRREGAVVTVVEADVYLNGTIAWNGFDGSTEGPILTIVLQHELLHVSGQLHPCEVDGSSGAPHCASNEELYRTSLLYPLHELGSPRLSPDDLLGLCTMYPSPSCGSAICPAGLVCIEGACRSPEDVIACGTELDCASCAEDAECAEGRVCVRGACRSLGELGAACETDGECHSGLCAERRCSIECRAGAPCPAGYDCTDAGWCRLRLLSRDPCTRGEDCASRLCLVGPGSLTCTNACSDARQCLPAEECAEVEGTRVCVSPVASGCAVREPGADGSGAAMVLLMAMSLVWRRRGRRARALGATGGGQ